MWPSSWTATGAGRRSGCFRASRAMKGSGGREDGGSHLPRSRHSLPDLYAFSTENWKRPRTEVEALMRLLRRFLEAELPEMLQNNIRLHVIGCAERLPVNVQQLLTRACARRRPTPP